MSESPEYRTWWRMIQRCHDPKHKDYVYYGARDIAVCDAWRASFASFYADMGRRPEGMEIERRDNDGNYEPSNCRWATRLEQMRNCRRNRMLTFRGATKAMSQWADELGIDYFAIRERLKKGWNVDRALTTPVRKCRPRATAS
jgi:hypothetical protein